MMIEYLHTGNCFKIKHSRKELPQQITTVLIAAFNFFNFIFYFKKKKKIVFPSKLFLESIL